jgi:hypothetical protein
MMVPFTPSPAIPAGNATFLGEFLDGMDSGCGPLVDEHGMLLRIIAQRLTADPLSMHSELVLTGGATLIGRARGRDTTHQPPCYTEQPTRLNQQPQLTRTQYQRREASPG